MKKYTKKNQKNSRKKGFSITLISPYPDSSLTDMKEPSHGLAYIAASLLPKGYSVEIIDAKQLLMKTDAVSAEIIKKKPDIVGITAMTPDIIWAAKIADGIKRILPDTPIIIGGPHVTALPERSLHEFPSFDIAVIGEGEITINKLVEHFNNNKAVNNLSKISGIAYRKNGKIITTPKQEYIKDLNSLNYPAWHLFPDNRNKPYPIYATRGCPFQCIFCQRILGTKLRRRSVENVVDEIEWILNNFNATGFWFADETFGLDKKWTEQLFDLMNKKGVPQRIHWYAQTRIDILTEEFILKMKKAGCDGIAFGVESGNPEILKKSGKKIKLENVGEVVKSAKKNGLKTHSFFILGHPHETMETIKDTIKFAAKINTDFVSFSVMVPYPGTEVWNLAQRKEGGYNYVSDNWDDYRKHLAQPLGFESIPPEALRRLDFKAYLYFYTRNLRFIDLFKFLWNHRASIKAYFLNKIKG